MNKILMGAFGAVVVSVGGIVAESIRELAMESTNNRIAREIANAVADAVAYVSQVYLTTKIEAEVRAQKNGYMTLAAA